MKQIRRHYPGGLNETALLDEEEIELSLIGERPVVKHRPDGRTPPVRRTGDRDRENLLRRARVKAWGMPY